MDKLFAIYDSDGILTIQRAEYIEDGWYIKNICDSWILFEIPQYGGEAQFIDNYPDFHTAYKAAKELT